MLGTGLGAGQAAQAVTFVVTDLGDAGPGTMRQAVLDSNAAPGLDEIELAPGLTGTITLTSGQLVVAGPLKIRGPGSATLAVSGGGVSRVFYLDDGVEDTQEVVISGLTVRDAPGPGAAIFAREDLALDDVVVEASGRGIHVETAILATDQPSLKAIRSRISGNSGLGIFVALPAGSVTLEEVVISDNAEGGIWIDFSNGQSLTIRDSTLAGNTGNGALSLLGFAAFGDDALVEDSTITGNTGAPGGAISAGQVDDLTIRRSIVSGNVGSEAGGIWAFESATTIESSTISENRSSSGAGGIFQFRPRVFNSPGLTIESVIRDSTISGNTTGGAGGGLLVIEAPRPLRIVNSTVSGNVAAEQAGGIGVFATFLLDATITVESSTISGNTSESGEGAGIFAGFTLGPGDAAVTVRNSIVADGVGGHDLATTPGGTFLISHALVESPGTAEVTDDGGNLLGVDPQLGPLQDNGGPTATHLPAFTSPVIDAGDPGFAPPPATDQRGLPRVGGTRIDLGAVELQPGVFAFALADSTVWEDGVSATLTVTRTGGHDGSFDIQFAATAGSATDGADFIATAGTLSWGDGDGSPRTFQVTIVDDPFDETGETVLLTLTSLGGATLEQPAQAVLTILDDENSIAEIPTLGVAARLLLAAAAAATGALRLRGRRRSGPGA